MHSDFSTALIQNSTIMSLLQNRLSILAIAAIAAFGLMTLTMGTAKADTMSNHSGGNNSAWNMHHDNDDHHGAHFGGNVHVRIPIGSYVGGYNEGYGGYNDCDDGCGSPCATSCYNPCDTGCGYSNVTPVQVIPVRVIPVRIIPVRIVPITLVASYNNDCGGCNTTCCNSCNNSCNSPCGGYGGGMYL